MLKMISSIFLSVCLFVASCSATEANLKKSSSSTAPSSICNVRLFPIFFDFNDNLMPEQFTMWQANENDVYIDNGELVIETGEKWNVVQVSLDDYLNCSLNISGNFLTAFGSRFRVDIYDANNDSILVSSLYDEHSDWNNFEFDIGNVIEGYFLRVYPYDISDSNFKVHVDDLKIKMLEAGKKKDELKVKWDVYIRPIIFDLDVNNALSLYDFQTKMMFVVNALFNLNRTDEIDELLSALIVRIKKLPRLKDLRTLESEGLINLSEELSSFDKTGDGERRVFPTKDPAGTVYDDKLSILQFSYLLSFIAKQIVLSKEQFYSETEMLFLNEVVPFLANEILFQYYFASEAWWYKKAGGYYPNMQALLRAKLFSDPKLVGRSYFSAITDFELFAFAIASDLQFIDNHLLSLLSDFNVQDGSDFFMMDKGKIRSVLQDCLDTFNERLANDDYFIFDRGVWDDHPDHAYEFYFGSQYPDAQYPPHDGSWDTSHFHRFPWWLNSYRDAYNKDDERYLYYEELIQRLSAQFVKYVWIQTDDGPLLTNYMAGTNGWYRVKSNWGYGPFTLSNTAINGSWYILARSSDEICHFNNAMQAMINSTDPNVIRHRTKFFGGRDYSQRLNGRGLRSVDLLGEESLYGLYLHMHLT